MDTVPAPLLPSLAAAIAAADQKLPLRFILDAVQRLDEYLEPAYSEEEPTNFERPQGLEHRHPQLSSMFLPLKPEPTYFRRQQHHVHHHNQGYAPMPVRPLLQFRFAPLAPYTPTTQPPRGSPNRPAGFSRLHPNRSAGSSCATTSHAPPSHKKKKKTNEQMTKQEKRKARTCRVEGCESYIINRGLCFRHGGGKRCTQPGCDSSAKNQGLCWKHGGSTSCIIEGCTRRGKARGLCWAHGGGTQCSTSGCTTIAVSNSKCWAHGGGKRCAYDDCTRAAYERTYNYCMKHHEMLRDGRHSVEI